MPASGMPVASTITSMPRMCDQRLRVGGDMRGAVLQRVVERRGSVLLDRPAGGRELASGALDVEVGERHEMQAARQPHLREEHGAELAGADQADGDGLAFRFAFKEEGMKVHAAILLRRHHQREALVGIRGSRGLAVRQVQTTVRGSESWRRVGLGVTLRSRRRPKWLMCEIRRPKTRMQRCCG